MKWWILFGIVIGVCIILWIRYRKEGFQTSRTMTALNVTYPFNEVFLVAPTDAISNVNIYGTLTELDYTNKGYTYDEAKKRCQNMGSNSPADLATPEQIYRAFDLSGNWCVKAWGNDKKLYSIANGNNKCGQNAGVIQTNPTANQKAFAICYAPKPPAPSPAVQPFQPLEYQMIPSSILNIVMNGTGSDITGIDIFPKQFTADQAYYALDQPFVYDTVNKRYDMYTAGTAMQFNIKLNRYEKYVSGPQISSLGNGSTAMTPSIQTLKYNSVAARQYLINNFDSVNRDILTKVDPTFTDNSSDWSGTNASGVLKSTAKSCADLAAVDLEYSTKLTNLRNLFKDVSGSVISLIWAKNENANIQATLYDICASTTPTTSPACAELAKIDFDTFYTDPTHSVLSDLEALNYYRFVREQEICTIIVNLKTIKDLLQCSYQSLITDCGGLTVNKSTKLISEYDPNDPLYNANR